MDLGTYHVRVEFIGGDGFIYKWGTGHRYTNGSGNLSPLDAIRIPASWESEEELLGNIRWMFTNGDYACDCNKRIFLARAHQDEPDDNGDCGDTLTIERLAVICPDSREIQLIP